MFKAREGASPPFSPWRSFTRPRSALSIASGVVPCALHTASGKDPEATLTAIPSDRPPRLLREQDLVRLRRDLGTRLVLRDPALSRSWCIRVGGLPIFEDRVTDAPLRLDLIVPGEKCRVAPHRVGDKALVGLRRLRQKSGAIQELHVHRSDHHSRARNLGAQAQRYALVGLQRED